MIGHDDAMQSAFTIKQYCAERFTGRERHCKDCIFHHRRCVLYPLFGMFGEDASKIAEEIVRTNYAERNDHSQDDN